MIRRTLALTAAATLFAGCTGNLGGLLNTALDQAKQQAGKPGATGSPAPAASVSPAPAVSASPAAGSSDGTKSAVTASVSLDGQAGTIKQEASARFTAINSVYSATYTVGDKVPDGSLMLIVSIGSKKPLTAADLGKADLLAFTANVVRLGGAGILSAQKILNLLQIPNEDITVTPNGGKLDVTANLTGFVGVGTVSAAQIVLKGLPTN
jgi:hypothetical protein